MITLRSGRRGVPGHRGTRSAGMASSRRSGWAGELVSGWTGQPARRRARRGARSLPPPTPPGWPPPAPTAPSDTPDRLPLAVADRAVDSRLGGQVRQRALDLLERARDGDAEHSLTALQQ